MVATLELLGPVLAHKGRSFRAPFGDGFVKEEGHLGPTIGEGFGSQRKAVQGPLLVTVLAQRKATRGPMLVGLGSQRRAILMALGAPCW